MKSIRFIPFLLLAVGCDSSVCDEEASEGSGSCQQVSSAQQALAAEPAGLVSQRCMNGKCLPLCRPGQTRCLGNTPQRCNLMGYWVNMASCSGTTPVCIGAGICGCPTAGGPTMVGLPLGYCIDSTEVTRDQYQAWLATEPTTSRQPSECAWNTDFTPAACTADPNVCRLPGSCGPNEPQTGVDWCDAHAYCKAVGKRLCGRIGGGTNPFADLADASRSQWYAACSSNGAYAYPYGNSYVDDACHAAASAPIGLADVASHDTCQSSVAGYGGVFDQSGNALEWEDSCNAAVGASDLCRQRGGFTYFYEDILTCGFGHHGSRATPDCHAGIRCCAP